MLNLTSLKSDRFLGEKISKLIPDWGIRQLSFDTLGNFCDQNGILVFEVPLSEADGYAFYQGDIPHLFFNAKLNYGGESSRLITSLLIYCCTLQTLKFSGGKSIHSLVSCEGNIALIKSLGGVQFEETGIACLSFSVKL